MIKRNKENRINHNTTIDDNLWTKLRFISFSRKENMNDLLEEAIEYLIEKYQDNLPKEMRPSSAKKSKSKSTKSKIG